MSTPTFRAVTCPGCGDSRDVSDRHARRLCADPDADLRCDTCRHPRHVEHGNDDIVWWLEWAGVQLAPGASGLAYVRVFGLPDRLQQLCTDMNGSVRYLP